MAVVQTLRIMLSSQGIVRQTSPSPLPRICALMPEFRPAWEEELLAEVFIPGAGVTDDGNGMTYSFDPAAAGVAIHILTYTYTDGNGCTNNAMDDVTVFATPVVNFTAPADLCIDAGVQAGLEGGTPTGGVYSGAGVTDDGNGMTYSFDPAAAGAGTHSLSYSFTNGNGCTDDASDDVEVFALPSVTFTALSDLCLDAGVQAGLGGGNADRRSIFRSRSDR